MGYGIVLVGLWLGRSTIRSTLVPLAERDAAQVTVQQAAASGRVRTLKRALKHREPRVRRDAAVALGHLGPDAKAAVPALIKTLRAEGDTYRQWEVAETRQAAAIALGHIGPAAESAVPALIEALQDKSNGAIFLRPAAATALGEIGQPVEQVVPTLTGVLRGRTISDPEIEPAVRALGRIGPGSEAAIPNTARRA